MVTEIRGTVFHSESVPSPDNRAAATKPVSGATRRARSPKILVFSFADRIVPDTLARHFDKNDFLPMEEVARLRSVVVYLRIY